MVAIFKHRNFCGAQFEREIPFEEQIINNSKLEITCV